MVAKHRKRRHPSSSSKMDATTNIEVTTTTFDELAKDEKEKFILAVETGDEYKGIQLAFRLRRESATQNC